MKLSLLDAPSNLGLRPPEEGAVPGCYKAPGVLRDLGLLRRLGARDAGVVTPPRYRAAWVPGTVRNEAGIAAYSRLLADRLEPSLGDGSVSVVLGGDCSILVGVGLALARMGRCGLVSVDGLDYRHPGNSDKVGAAGGESLAMVTGSGGVLAELDGVRPYVRPEDAAAVGFRPDDELAPEAAADGLHLFDAPAVSRDPAGVAEQVLDVVGRPDLDGFWVHFDADVIDPEQMPAVDSPEPGGLTFDEVAALLGRLAAGSGLMGMDVTIYDPDLDPSVEAGRRLAGLLADILTE